MNKPFIKIRKNYINLSAISYVESSEDGGVAITVMNRDQPFRLNRNEAADFLGVLARYTAPSRDLT